MRLFVLVSLLVLALGSAGWVIDKNTRLAQAEIAAEQAEEAAKREAARKAAEEAERARVARLVDLRSKIEDITVLKTGDALLMDIAESASADAAAAMKRDQAEIAQIEADIAQIRAAADEKIAQCLEQIKALAVRVAANEKAHDEHLAEAVEFEARVQQHEAKIAELHAEFTALNQ